LYKIADLKDRSYDIGLIKVISRYDHNRLIRVACRVRLYFGLWLKMRHYEKVQDAYQHLRKALMGAVKERRNHFNKRGL